ncbi:MAG: DUF5408 family protein [Helicobacter sp.]|uniref:DUF5408 family protein n=1 Tax=Helicobacter sp. TaxID=218 RepID=UPI0023C81223|nr:DUF5408 family protein [Helicobacter sp.]MDE5925560.1 DUF5408 family protein [Helicobacter sp.]MDE7174519.1 DUF5408 family protein [Helicobacter sp.]
MQENEQITLERAQKTALKAVKISLIACVILVIFASISLWVSLNQITATANLVKMQKEYALRLEKLEKTLDSLRVNQ